MQRNRLFLPEVAPNALPRDTYSYVQDTYVPEKSIACLKIEQAVHEKLSLSFPLADCPLVGIQT